MIRRRVRCTTLNMEGEPGCDTWFNLRVREVDGKDFVFPAEVECPGCMRTYTQKELLALCITPNTVPTPPASRNI